MPNCSSALLSDWALGIAQQRERMLIECLSTVGGPQLREDGGLPSWDHVDSCCVCRLGMPLPTPGRTTGRGKEMLRMSHDLEIG